MHSGVGSLSVNQFLVLPVVAGFFFVFWPGRIKFSGADALHKKSVAGDSHTRPIIGSRGQNPGPRAQRNVVQQLDINKWHVNDWQTCIPSQPFVDIFNFHQSASVCVRVSSVAFKCVSFPTHAWC